jgi:hypothetical protein
MALLNPPDILPEAMRYLVRALLALRQPYADRDELIGLISPPGLAEAMGAITSDPDDTTDAEPDDPKTGGAVITGASLDALRWLGIVEQDDSRISLTEAAATKWKKPADVTPRGMSQILLDAALRAADPKAPYGDGDKSNDLMQAVVLLYQADKPLLPFDRFESGRIPRPSGRAFTEWQAACCGPERKNWPVTNNQRWLPFRRWAPHLGLARSVGANGIIPDASEALIGRLSALQSGDYDIGDFVKRCALAVPVLDGGALWRRVEAAVDGDPRVLSGGLSISLLQLEAEGYMTMARPKSDTDRDGHILRLLPDRSTDRPIGTVTWLGTVRRGG